MHRRCTLILPCPCGPNAGPNDALFMFVINYKTSMLDFLRQIPPVRARGASLHAPAHAPSPSYVSGPTQTVSKRLWPHPTQISDAFDKVFGNGNLPGTIQNRVAV